MMGYYFNIYTIPMKYHQGCACFAFLKHFQKQNENRVMSETSHCLTNSQIESDRKQKRIKSKLKSKITLSRIIKIIFLIMEHIDIN